MKRKFTDHEIKEFVAGKINGEEANEDDLREMAIEIEDSPDDFEFKSYISETRDFTPENKQYSVSPELQKMIDDMPANPPVLRSPDIDELKFGQIFSTTLPANWPWKAQETRWVMLLSNTEGSINEDMPDVKVAPLSFEEDFATDTDVVINDQQVLNGHTFMIRFGDVQNIFTDQLKDYYGKMPKNYVDNLKQGWKYASGLSEQPAENSGSAIEQDDDPRVSFNFEEHDLTEYMRKPVSDMIADLEEQDELELTDDEIPGNVISLEHTIPNEWLESKAGTEEYALAAAKEKHFPLGEGKLFTIYASRRLELRLHITEDGLQLRLQLAKAVDKYRLTVKSMEGAELLAATGARIIPLRPADMFINRSLRIEIKTSIFTKTIRTKFFHGCFDSK